ncbi:MAG: 2-C-methyl-D-erythritol 4-phosphate cytidylyltransferase [Ruminococcus sp.]|jgi:2-C-methyl-D-erythritol 4-phosphate cytidylyltransferase|nr:2-C-methyl-D-erythritol 4-phosphate cytidylyltransferase [Ruminococcus sp.]
MKNTAIILSGGTGTRLNSTVPKQYIEVSGKPIICFCLEKFQACSLIDDIIIVADENYFEMLDRVLKTHNISKFKTFASAGITRQHSIYNALLQINSLPKNTCSDAENENFIIVHDSARPLVTENDIESLVSALKTSTEKFDGITPVLPVKDTVYVCEDGEIVSLLKRDTIFAGQTPEIYKFEKYLSAHEGVNLSEIRGSSEIAIKAGMKIGTCNGNENNFKITTTNDLNKFKTTLCI